ncbi:SGNH/GDSL hydrolase family protein [Lacticaseibacillus brantae]|uniref:Lipase acylhydrolase n=1 Tax=Lacticaseibacillus brantae DSM 23927 TaxID=1423727 RepID=A0A0R2B8C5_9LACO|nr:SGNH/GDSL hydrolase family protein [Lacticaseibacillus brantae]KRM72617.1 lipase acylhydrolase [Lacticaseibacillus brantae DSM 23927]
MKRWQNVLLSLGLLGLVAGLVFAGLMAFGPDGNIKAPKINNTVKTVKLVGLGDSLTQGVGDETKQGGYLPLIKADLEGNYVVSTENFGVGGNTSTQILKRLTTQTKIQKSIQSATVITVTVGGNDLMAVLKKDFLKLSEAQIVAGSKTFQKHLATLLTTIRQYNPKAPIYLFSIYNPFYVYFPEMTQMTDGVTKWNAATQATLKQFNRVHYVDIDRVMSTGKTAKASSRAESAKDNPLIFTEDHFHPNNAGYAQMTKVLYDEMLATKNEWE